MYKCTRRVYMYAGLYPLRGTCLGSPGQNVKYFYSKSSGSPRLGVPWTLWTPIARALQHGSWSVHLLMMNIIQNKTIKTALSRSRSRRSLKVTRSMSRRGDPEPGCTQAAPRKTSGTQGACCNCVTVAKSGCGRHAQRCRGPGHSSRGSTRGTS